MSEFWTGQSGEYGNPGAGEPLQEGWLENDAATNQEPVRWGEVEPIPVRVTHTESQRVAPEATAFMTFPIPQIPQASGAGATQAQQICPHRYHRYKAKFLFSGGAAGTIYVAKDPNTLMSGALGAAFAIVVAAALTQATQLMPEYDGQQPLYMMATVPGFVVSVMDEGYKAVQ